ncbi:MAG TPA: phosphotransferase [Candidatus Binatus sp.]|nr:phosphotransferase [Candidatus Binatus sp.]
MSPAEPLAFAQPLDLQAALAWIGASVGPPSSVERHKERAWATTLRVTVGRDTVWFKACQPVQAFEPRLTADLAERWPDRLPRVLAVDDARGWLLTADAGVAVGSLGNSPEIWLRALPRYAELQVGETPRAADHLAHGVPDLRLERLSAELAGLVASDVPLRPRDANRLRRFEPRFGELCGDLRAAGVGETVQHDDLHLNGLFVRGDELRFLDWGDASIGHPFFSLVVTFRFLESRNALPPGDPWFGRLRDAYLEPFGAGLVEVFGAAWRVGLIAHACAWRRHRDAMPEAARAAFDIEYAALLRWVVARAVPEP